MATSAYTKYYTIQAGAGHRHHSNIGPLFRANDFVQRGYGIGSIFAKMLKYIAPMAINGLQALTDTGLKTGKGVYSDIINNKPLEQIAQERGKEALLDLTEKGINKIMKK